MDLTLVILAAGIGSRYGGLKQIEPVGSTGELIIDYSLFDAVRAGFNRFVFVVRPDIEADVRAIMDARIGRRHDCAYVHQTLTTALPPGTRLPPERNKPLGTAHAVLACAAAVQTPFAVINADDFYGADAYRQLARFLAATPPDGTDYAMVAYRLANTLSDHGTVARGICTVSPDGWLQQVEERTAIEPAGDGARYLDAGGTGHPLNGDLPVSMNCWGFTPAVFSQLAGGLPAFLQSLDTHPKNEYFLPTVIDTLIRHERCRVRVLPSDAPWFGVTYPADKPVVQRRIQELAGAGEYPAPLWK